VDARLVGSRSLGEEMSAPLHRLPYVHGWADQLAGKGFLDNPYDSYTDDGRIWIDGYVASMIAHRRGPSGGANE